MSSSEEDEEFKPRPAQGLSASARTQDVGSPALPAVGNGNGKGAAGVRAEEDDDAEGEDDDGVVDNIEPDSDDEDEDEEEEEDSDEDDGPRRNKPKKKKRKLNRFLDVEAVVDDEDEEEDEEGDYAGAENDFIEHDRVSPDYNRDQGHHRLLDLRRDGEKERSARDLAQELDERYKRSAKYQGDSNLGPSKANMPTPFDPKLWRVSCKGGKEKDIIRAILQKSFHADTQGEDLGITAAFQRDTIRETIYVEARQPQDVLKALAGVSGVYLQARPRAGPAMPGREHVGKGPMIVPRDDMVPLLTMKKKEVEAKEGMWVRVKRGKYTSDLAQISEIVQDGMTAVVMLVPRIDYNPSERSEDKKRKKIGFSGSSASAARPPARLFNVEDVQRAYGKGSVSKRQDKYIFQADDYNTFGLLEKEFPLASLQLENVKPTLDEISLFPQSTNGESTGVNVNLDVIADAARKTAGSNIQPGDPVEVHEGEQVGMRGVVETVRGGVVTVRANREDADGEKTALIELPLTSVRKLFKEGDHVKVMSGKNQDETGLVIDVDGSGNIVTIWSDLSAREIKVFARDLREAAEVGVGTNRVGEYELHDLVMIDNQTAGVIFQTERDGVKVLDQNGGVRSLKLHQISGKAESRFKPVGLDSKGKEFRRDDQMKELEGEQRKGHVLQIYRSVFCFLLNRDIAENQGVFVVRCNNLGPVDRGSDAGASNAVDLTKMNPALAQPSGKSGIMTTNLRHLINTRVVITKGSFKGLIGIIKDMNGEKARVELQTNNRVVDQNVAHLKRKDDNGATYPLDLMRGARPPQAQQPPPQFGSMGPPTGLPPSQNPYMSTGGATPAPGGLAYGMTPNPYANAGGRTPAPNYGQTPNPYANAGGRTPGYAAGGATPGGALGGRTPAAAYGGATPAPGGYGGYGGSTDYGSMGSASGTNPYAAPTPGRYGSASYTPGGASANPYTPSGGIAFSPAAGPSFLSRGGAGSVNPYSSTPGYGGMNTPAGYGSTPLGGGGGRGSVAPLHENWSQGITNILVTLSTSLATQRSSSTPLVYENNIYQQDVFIVQSHAPSVLRPMVCSLKSTLQLDENGQPLTLVVPIQYLRPVVPTREGEQVMVLVGEMREKIGRTVKSEGGWWNLDVGGGKMWAAEQLCKVAM